MRRTNWSSNLKKMSSAGSLRDVNVKSHRVFSWANLSRPPGLWSLLAESDSAANLMIRASSPAPCSPPSREKKLAARYFPDLMRRQMLLRRRDGDLCRSRCLWRWCHRSVPGIKRPSLSLNRCLCFLASDGRTRTRKRVDTKTFSHSTVQKEKLHLFTDNISTELLL